MKRKYIVLMMVSALSLSSCKFFLEEKVYDFYSPSNMYQSASDAEVAIVGVYAPLINANLFRTEAFQLIDLDQDHGCAEGWVINAGFADGNWQNCNSKFKNVWEQLYLIIERANVVIDKVPGIKMDETLKNQIVGEAYFMRTFAYFYLVRMWGRVPVRASSFKEDKYVYDSPRVDIKTIYKDVIIDGLLKAEQLTQYKSSSLAIPVGRANKGVVKALLTKVYLQIASAAKVGTIYVKCGTQIDATKYKTDEVGNSIIAVQKTAPVTGYEGFDATEYFQLASKKALELIALEGTPDGYSLKSNFMDVFKGINKDEIENIFNLSTSGLDASTLSDFHQYYSYKGDLTPASGYGRGYAFMGNSFYNSYLEESYGKKALTPTDRNNRDYRIVYGVKRVYTRLGSDNLPKQWFYPQSEKAIFPEFDTKANGGDGSGYASDNDTGCSTKFESFSASSELRYTDATVSFIRYADVLLMYAEALNETVGPIVVDSLGKTAIDYVNRIRTRSNAIPITANMNCYDGDIYPSLGSVEGLRSFIMEERGRELFYEMNRVFDLKRWGMYLDVMNNVNAIRTMNKKRQEKHLLFPIPVEEIRANSALSQSDNNGW